MKVAIFLVPSFSHSNAAIKVANKVASEYKEATIAIWGWDCFRDDFISLACKFEILGLGLGLPVDMERGMFFHTSTHVLNEISGHLRDNGVTHIVYDRFFPCIGLLGWILKLPQFSFCHYPLSRYTHHSFGPPEIFFQPYFHSAEERNAFEEFFWTSEATERRSSSILSFIQVAHGMGYPLSRLNLQIFPSLSSVKVLSLVPKALGYPSEGREDGVLFNMARDIPSKESIGRISFLVSFGTVVLRFASCRRVFALLFSLFQKHPEWSAIFAAGSLYDEYASKEQTSNLKLERFVPQVELLSHVNVLVTHAGMTSVLEAVEQGTPMLAIPFAYDQPGNAKRIEFHEAGLAVMGPGASEQLLEDALQQVLNNITHYRAGVQRLRSACLREQEEFEQSRVFDSLWTCASECDSLKEKIASWERDAFPLMPKEESRMIFQFSGFKNQ